MATSYQSIALYIGDRVKPLGRLVSFWRKLAPLRGLIFVISFHLLLSLGYIVFFTWSFSFGKRIIVLHLSIISAMIAVVTLGMGFLLFLRPIREWRPARFLFSLIPATGLSILTLLYIANYFSNSLWGENITYDLIAQYVFGGVFFQKEMQLLPGRIYLSVAAGLLMIFSVHLAASRPLLRSLEELFMLGRGLSMFRNRRRAVISGASILLSLLLIALAGFQSLRMKPAYRLRTLLHEPITGLFMNPDGLNTFMSYSFRTNLEAEESRTRSNYAPGQSFDKKNVVIIVVDALRADHMQVYGYERPTTPFLASLLKTGNLKKVEAATSTCSSTTCGVMSILSSKTPVKQIPQVFKLQDLLYDQGYQINFILSGNHRWYNLRQYYGDSLTYYFDGSRSVRYNLHDDRLIFEGLENVPDFTGTPGFFYFHLLSTHEVGVIQEKYVKYQPARNWVGIGGQNLDPSLVTNYYDNAVIQADAVIEQIFATLKQKGYLADSLVFILADHGEALGQRGHSVYGHVKYLYQECISIPMLIYDDDDGANYANLKYATQIDVAPTIVDRLGLAVPSSWQGQSLLSPGVRQYSFHQTTIHPYSYAVIYRTDRATYKYLRHPGQGEELYELVSDPREKDNLINKVEQALVEDMREKMAEYNSVIR